MVVVSMARRGCAGVVARKRLSGDGAVEGAGGAGAVAAGSVGCWLGQRKLRVVWGHSFAHDGSAAAASRSVGARDPDAINLDAALDCANTKGDLVLGLFVNLRYRLGLEHFGSGRAFALVDLAVLANLVLVIPEFEQAKEDGEDNAASQYLGSISKGRVGSQLDCSQKSSSATEPSSGRRCCHRIVQRPCLR